MTLRIVNIAGCRPNFIKIAPLLSEMKRHAQIEPILVHTGQHYDRAMSDLFFRDLEIPEPDVSLDVGSGTYAHQTGQVMQRLEPVLREIQPDLVLVVGDVNSTLAAALSAVTLGYPVAHVEAGLRSFDREMPEEINRVLTDAISDFLFITEPSAETNLLREGKRQEQIFFAGNVMMDSLRNNAAKIAHSAIVSGLGLTPRNYALLTLHRPSNVDDPGSFAGIAGALEEIQHRIPIVFPVHPRTAARLEQFPAARQSLAGLLAIEPLGYVDFIKLMQQAAFVLTDSGGVQEETTALQIPCLTLRDNTERPVTISAGTNCLVGTAPQRIVARVAQILDGAAVAGHTPEKWDGRAAGRIVSMLAERADQIKDLYRGVRERSACLNTFSLVSHSRP